MAPSQPTEVVAWANKLLESERVGRLGLLDDEGAPRVLPVTFALAEGLIWSAINNKPKRAGEPARLRFLRRDSRAALTVDHYSDDWAELAGVQVLGWVRIVDPSEGRDRARGAQREVRAVPGGGASRSAAGSEAGAVSVLASADPPS